MLGGFNYEIQTDLVGYIKSFQRYLIRVLNPSSQKFRNSRPINQNPPSLLGCFGRKIFLRSVADKNMKYVRTLTFYSRWNTELVISSVRN